ncbi:hypothetical protein E3J62_06375 [candidate division TA06 bacterium]|uniref:FlgD/Vpr Ig-like domain-containing protein n=1 Tax=candidate division TA06 bacterium TaxID=2250710 RepID=A0A523UTD9_UNCT6|nr:MAG: hypothetical protein E3J62_06375 [candidate division TA06 bacterium]
MKFSIFDFQFIVVFLLVFVCASASAAVPLGPSPIWESVDNDFSTGGALADVDRDGYLDLFVGNGNDMALNSNSVYMNQNGVLEDIGSWVSFDQGYFGHNAVGDVDNDGDIDMAVAYYGGVSAGFVPYIHNIYYNIGDSLERSPSWRNAMSDTFNSFDCAFGDVDGDGDLDIVFSGGEMYSSRSQSSRLYLNTGGVFETIASWTSLLGYAYGVAWGDVDNDGDLDLAIGNEQNYNHLYYNNGGVLESSPSWQSDEIATANQIAFGDVDGDGWVDLAVSNGADCRIYFNQAGTLEVHPSWKSADAKSNYSCIALGDVDADGDLDLASGGWWEPLVVFENFGGTLDTVPTWSWYPGGGKSLVCEEVVWGDVDGDGVLGSCDALDGDGVKKIFYFLHYPVHAIEDILVDGDTLAPTDYCYDLNAGWISFKDAPSPGMANVVMCYDYSGDLDLIVTNWDPPTGNFLLDNISTGIMEYAGARNPDLNHIKMSARPNPFVASTTVDISLPVEYAETHGSLSSDIVVAIYDVGGRLVKELKALVGGPGSHFSAKWDGKDGDGRKLPAGTYFVSMKSRRLSASCKVVLLR